MRRLTEEAARQVRTSVREARRLGRQAARSRSRADRSPAGRAKALAELEGVASLAERVVGQVRQRFAGEKIADQLVSLFDTGARPIRRGKLARPNEFGYVVQIAEVGASTKRGARGLVLPPKLATGSAGGNTLLPRSADEFMALGLRPREAAFDAGFGTVATDTTMAAVRPDIELSIAGSKRNAGSRRTLRRRTRYRSTAKAASHTSSASTGRQLPPQGRERIADLAGMHDLRVRPRYDGGDARGDGVNAVRGRTRSGEHQEDPSARRSQRRPLFTRPRLSGGSNRGF